MKFGFLPLKGVITGKHWQVEPLPDLDDAIDDVGGDPQNDGGWIYPLIGGAHANATSPLRPAPRFILPNTHALVRQSGPDDVDFHRFQIACLGFFTGLRLLPDGYGHLHKTPIKQGTLCDFVVSPKQIAECLDRSDAYYQRLMAKTPQCIQLALSAINLLQLGQSYEHQFEEFQFLYSALDTCYEAVRIADGIKKRENHSKRIAWLCDRFKIPPPTWLAKAGAGKPGRKAVSGDTVVDIRNDLIHGGMLGRQPVGHSVFSDNLPLELGALVCRVLFAMLAGPAGYIETSCRTRATHGLDLA